MKCPKCQFENSEEMQFCGKCGAKLERICPKCNFPNPPQFIFCGKCGYNLTTPSEPTPRALSYDEKIEKIQRYLPEGITEKILSQRNKIEGERKQVTVMFCDMEGFTTLVEKLGPEEAYSIMDQVYEILIHKVHDYEGTVNEMTGDGIMALFGAPIALEDAPQRSIRSAMAIHREMARFSDKLKQEQKTMRPLKMRIGINTGPVVVGTLGNDLRVEFKAVGDTVNLASRMEELAEPGTTYVTKETFKLTEGFFRFEALGERIIKGKEKPTNIYRVLAPSSRRTRFDVSAERGLTPFVGRERELELLLDGYERSKAGRGQAFSIVSEAGVGKSRLLYEFRKAISNEDVTFLEGRCLSYSRGISYHPIIDILKANFDIQEADGDSEIKEKVQRGLKILRVDEPSTLPYLLELLSVKDSGIDKIPMSPEARKDRIIEALKRIVMKGSDIRPLIMAIEDLHWIDKSSEDMLKYLLESISGARVFLIFTYRPEFVHIWGGRSYHSQVNLNRLSNRESLAMVTNLLGTEEIERDLQDLILEKTEGVPFFIEEFIKSFKDLKIIEKKDNKYHLTKDIQELTIPSTIQDVIMARIDSLPEGAKEVLQIGSVIEREFSYELIKRVTEFPEQELLSRLSALKDSELLYERGIYPQSTYIFKHALTQEVVYDSILTKRKKKLHEEIGNAIEELYKESIDEQYVILSEHFVKSENYDKGAEYSKLASRKALKSASLNDAVAYARKGIACLERLPQIDVIQRKIIDARAVLAGYHINLGHIAKANEAVAPIADLALELNYQKKLPSIYAAIGLYSLWVKEAYSEGFRYLNEALKISEETKDFISFWLTSYNLGWYLSWNCEFERGLEYFKKCLDLSTAANNLIGTATAKGTMSATNFVVQGKIDLAYQTSKESLRLAEDSGDIFVKAFAYTAHGISCYFKGLFDQAEDYLPKGLDFCEKTTNVSWGAFASFTLGDMRVDMGEYEIAEHYYNKAIEILLEHGELTPSGISLGKVFIARSKVLKNDKDINFSDLSKYYKKNRLKIYEGLTARYIGEILLSCADLAMPKAEDWIKKAIEADTKNDMRFNLGRDYALYAELFSDKGDITKARENLNKAIEIYKECGADGWVKKAEKKLAALS
jgi:class 3 adenylate cyclase/tetratricopeptide (TPR) repeat protein